MLPNKDPYAEGTRTTPEERYTLCRHGHDHPGSGNPLIGPNCAKEINVIVKGGKVIDQDIWARWQAANPGIELSSPEVIAKADAAKARAKVAFKEAVIARRVEYADADPVEKTPSPADDPLEVLRKKDEGRDEMIDDLEMWDLTERMAA